MQNWHKPVLHMHVVRILRMVPIYAGASWLAVRFFHEALYINAVQCRARLGMPRGAARRAGYHQPQGSAPARAPNSAASGPLVALAARTASTHMHVGGLHVTQRDVLNTGSRPQHLSALHRLNFFIGTHMEQSYWEFVHP